MTSLLRYFLPNTGEQQMLLLVVNITTTRIERKEFSSHGKTMLLLIECKAGDIDCF